MGGLGSGNWYRWGGRKATVEESLSLGVADFRDRLHPHAGTFTWTYSAGHKASIGYFVTWDNDGPTVTLHYQCRGEIDVRIPIRLQATYPALGGQRWWFTCPLIVNGRACNRRAGKLYLPPGGRYFGCRVCHRLTYVSAQEAHQMERVFARLERGYADLSASLREETS